MHLISKVDGKHLQNINTSSQSAYIFVKVPLSARTPSDLLPPASTVVPFADTSQYVPCTRPLVSPFLALSRLPYALLRLPLPNSARDLPPPAVPQTPEQAVVNQFRATLSVFRLPPLFVPTARDEGRPLPAKVQTGETSPARTKQRPCCIRFPSLAFPRAPP